MPPVAVRVLNYVEWIVEKVGELDGEPQFIISPVGDPVLQFIQIVLVPDGVLFSDLIRVEETSPDFLAFLAGLVLNVPQSFTLPTLIWKVVSYTAGTIFFSVLADQIFIEEVSGDVIKTKNISISGKGVVDVGTQLDIRKNGELWFWRGIISVTSYDESRVDVLFDNPNRFYFGLCTLSYYGNTFKPEWIRTQNAYIDTHQVTPNYEGKADNVSSSYPNLQFSYPRADRVIYDLRPTVLATLKLTAVKCLENLLAWW